MKDIPQNSENSKPAQDPGLVEVCARALRAKADGQTPEAWSLVGDLQKFFYKQCTRAVLTALLPHLSEESRARLEKELG